MLKYAKKLKQEYESGQISEIGLVRGVLQRAIEEVERKKQKEMLAKRWIIALYQLSIEKGPLVPVADQEIRQKLGLEKSQTSSGLGVWDDRGCNIVEKKPGAGRQYLIRNNFYKAVGCCQSAKMGHFGTEHIRRGHHGVI